MCKNEEVNLNNTSMFKEPDGGDVDVYQYTDIYK